MRILMISKACIVGQYQTKLEALAHKPNLDLTVVVPPFWRDERGVIPLERQHTNGYDLIVAPLRFNGHYHLHYYPSIRDLIARLEPELVHVDEEPYNLATAHAIYHAQRAAPRARLLFFTWQNLLRRYPPPFSWIENFAYAKSDCAIAGSDEAMQVLRAKGFSKPIRVIPQFGVPDAYQPASARTDTDRDIVIGFAGRLVEEKGTALLLRALARVDGNWKLRILGSGPLRKSLAELAFALKIADRVQFDGSLPSSEMPSYFNSLDLFVLPSLSRPNWKEQFGRVLVEAMACGVPVIGSSSGEIPNVIGDAGIIFPEGNVEALAQAVRELVRDPARRTELGARGRSRVLNHFTQARVVDETYSVYCQLLRGEW